MSTQYKKVIEDLFANLSKTILVILSIALGVLSLGVILDTYSITDREIQQSYLATNPASFSICVEQSDAKLMEFLMNQAEIKQLQSRRTITSRVQKDTGKWFQAILYVLNPREEQQIKTYYALDGKHIPEKDEILLENTSLSVVDAAIEDNLYVKLPQTSPLSLLISGRVQADGTNPAWMHEQVIGYISEDTIEDLSLLSNGKEFLIVLADNNLDRDAISFYANQLSSVIESKGYHVNYIFVPEPGEHPNAAQMNAILLLFRIFGALALILSMILVYSIVSAVMQEQIRQIAIMKSMGASNHQIRSMYYLYVIILGVIAAILVIPSARMIATSLSRFTSAILVFSIDSTRVPLSIYLLQFTIAIGIPALGAFIPIERGCRITIIRGLFDRNRQKVKISKFLFSILTLATGGAIFMASVNVRSSLEKSFSETIAQYKMDTQLILSSQHTEEAIEVVLAKIPDIDNYWINELTYAEMIDSYEGDAIDCIYDQSEPLQQLAIKYKNNVDINSASQETEMLLAKKNIDILSVITMKDAELIFNKHLYSVASFLVAASVIVISVGMISLISIAKINISEHIRELGIMRSFGAGSISLFCLLYRENLITGLLGFALSLLTTLPLSIGIGASFGKIFLGEPLPLSISIGGIIIWLGITLFICTSLSLFSVHSSLKKPVYEILSY